MIVENDILYSAPLLSGTIVHKLWIIQYLCFGVFQTNGVFYNTDWRIQEMSKRSILFHISKQSKTLMFGGYEWVGMDSKVFWEFLVHST